MNGDPSTAGLNALTVITKSSEFRAVRIGVRVQNACALINFNCFPAKGAVFVTGDNEGQKLGTRSTAPIIHVPEVIPLNVPIKDACCGASHTFLLSMDESKILAFGSNQMGQLGMPNDVETVVEPTEIDMDKMFEGYQLKLVACGAMHTAFITGTFCRD